MKVLADLVEGITVLVCLYIWATVVVFFLAQAAECPVSLTSLWGEMLVCAMGVR